MLWDYVYNTLNSFSCREEKVSSVMWTHIRYGTLHNFKPVGQNEFKIDSIFFLSLKTCALWSSRISREKFTPVPGNLKKRFWGEPKTSLTSSTIKD